MKKETVKTILKNIPVFLMFAMLFAFALLFVLHPKKEFSETENRMLAQFPEVSFKKISSGEFQNEFETYLSDQFPLRDKLLSVSVRASALCGKKEINDVIYAGEENGETRLFDIYKKPENKEKFVSSVRGFAGKLESAEVTVMVVPTAINLYEDELPALYKMQERPLQKDTLDYFEKAFSEKTEDGNSSEIAFVKGIPELLSEEKNEGTNLYYRTDHHWTIRGAYAGYRCLAPYLDIPVREKAEADFITVSEDFYGTTWSKVCDGTVNPDRIEIYENPSWKGSLEVSYEDTKENSDSPYNREYLNKKDQYSMFLNNQHSLVRISNPAADTERCSESGHSSLVIIKDSYANSLVPLLIDQYETIWIIDPRYYKGSISSWVNEHKEAEDILILYNLGTMDSDRGIGGIY